MLKTATLAAAVSLAVAGQAAATTHQFTDLLSWASAAGPTTVADFNFLSIDADEPLDFRSKPLPLGEITLSRILPPGAPALLTQEGFAEVRSDSQLSQTNNVVMSTGFEPEGPVVEAITFAEDTNSFAADFSSLNRQDFGGTRIVLLNEAGSVVGQVTPPLTPDLDFSDHFFGVVSSVAFSQVRFEGLGRARHDGGRSGETFAMDNVRFDEPGVVIQPVFGVPEPATWSLMIAGTAMAGAALRRRRAAA